MSIATYSLPHHVYAKTAKGQDEIVRPKFGLNPRQRRILTFVDGIHALSALHEYFPAQEMEDIISVLSGQHFIRLIGERQENISALWRQENGRHVYRWNGSIRFRHPDNHNRRLTGNEQKILKAKDFMLEVAAIHLGILGRDIVQKIKSSEGAESLASLAGQWTMALCASKTAARYAQLYLEQLKWILFDEQNDSSDSDFS